MYNSGNNFALRWVGRSGAILEANKWRVIPLNLTTSSLKEEKEGGRNEFVKIISRRANNNFSPGLISPSLKETNEVKGDHGVEDLTSIISAN